MRTIFDTVYGMSTALTKQASQALPFLIKNAKRFELTDKDRTDLATIRSTVRTPIIDFFNMIVAAEALNEYLIFDFSQEREPVPTILTVDDVTIDGGKLEGTPEALQKIWYNVTPVLGRRAARTDRLILNDIPTACAHIVRGMLCRGYSDKDLWLVPGQAAFVIESYSMAVRMLLTRAYNLAPDEAALVQTAFATFYAKILGPKDAKDAVPALLNRAGFLGTYSDIMNQLSMLNEKAPSGDFTSGGIVTTCQAVAAAGPARMKDFTVQNFIRMFSVGNVDYITTVAAVDYPPYWVYLLLKYASGSKNSLMGNLFRLTFMKKKLDPFIEKMLTQRDLIIKR